LKFTPKHITQLAATHYGLQGDLKALPGYVDLNYRLTTPEGKYIIKITSSDTDLARLQMQNEVLLHVRKHVPDVRTQDVLANIKGEYLTHIQSPDGTVRYLRILTYLEGDLWANIRPHTPALLESMGKNVALLCKGLNGYEHPAAHFDFKWNSSNADTWLEPHFNTIKDPTQIAIIYHFFHLFKTKFLPQKNDLRQGVHQNDANDYNVLVNTEKQEVTGIIDFGDTVFTHTINELAIAIAYAAMHKPDPLTAAADVVRGFHQTFPLNENELDVLWTMIGARLMVSVVNSAMGKIVDADNEYRQISERPAWDLLRKMYDIHPDFAHYTFRHACGFEPYPKKQIFMDWAATQHAAKIVGIDLQNAPIHIHDFTVGSLELGNNLEFEDIDIFTRKTFNTLAEKKAVAGIGRYLETRPFYTTDSFVSHRNQGPEWRTVHLGLDVFMDAESVIYAPVDGTVFSLENNNETGDYGPTIILEHKVNNNLTFWTLYGHLTQDSIDNLSLNQVVKKGDPLCKMGDYPVNGNWPPHLHFQVILDIFDYTGNYPGVAYFSEKEIWESICPNPNTLFKIPPRAPLSSLKRKSTQVDVTSALTSPLGQREASESILKSRQNHLAKNLSISYKKPLYMVRGSGQYLYDVTGRRYLDTINNVAHVGHEHPRVVEAAKRQIAVLNTNTRYLHENLVRYAEELAATFPAPLDTCFFVNSGSEANELALRIAKTTTGRRDMIALQVGYHGNTNACVDVSSYKFDGKGGKGAPAHTHIVPMPDTYRGIYRDTKNVGLQYANHVKEAVQKAKIAAFIAEPIMSCGGQVPLPDGYLKAAFEVVREAGGLCILDEVQHGFGRVGEAFWGFELQGVVPDIVTMGKPIGNGHPMGAVITTRALADEFANGMEFFTTFGGNPVSCAIGREVLQIVKDENLQENASVIGEYLKAGLRNLQSRFPIIGDVRGHGFFLGFELVQHPETKTPAPKQTTYLFNRMRTLGILTSTDGLDHNVIKIKPPMVFNQANADFMLDMLERVFKEEMMAV